MSAGIIVSGAGGSSPGGAGDASAANQDEQTALLTTIDGDTGSIATSAAAILVDTGQIQTAVEAILADTADIEIATEAAAVDLAAMEVLLTGIDSDTNAIATVISPLQLAQTDTVDAAEHGIAPLFIVDAALSAIAPTDGQAALARVDANGAIWTQLAGAISSAVDSIASVGNVAHDDGDSGNPVKIGWKAANALPTAVANNDRANGISDLWGRQMVTHIDPAQQIHKSFNATTTQTGTDVWSPASGKKIAVTDITISTYDTTGARIILWFGDNADTTYTAGTDQVLEIFSAVPSATIKPGLAKSYTVPKFCTTADRELHLTTDAAIDVDIVIEGYEW